jgi:hypothetical protein
MFFFGLLRDALGGLKNCGMAPEVPPHALKSGCSFGGLRAGGKARFLLIREKSRFAEALSSCPF